MRALSDWDVKSARLPLTSGEKGPVARLTSATFGLDEEEGWLMGPLDNRLVWVTEGYRQYLQISPCRLFIGKYRIVVLVRESGWHSGIMERTGHCVGNPIYCLLDQPD